MTKVLLGFQLISSSLIHLLCCGLPILISINGGLSVFAAFQTFTPLLIGIQLLVSGFTFYQLYKPAGRSTKAIRNQRIIFWSISILSIVLFFYPPADWFKSEETRLKQVQVERFFKSKIQ
ncbi:hypothetical protein [Emticicia sp. C21]|uniref:hypothetical protein n=1 Tax=Emticicia sp. C21 TaxID=2302915 RepID=UPI000E346DDE|nr:hypothetical protein [Emticicia sp. C21]RFS14243.1 hypothetical protein D0T08_22145 [Emticicia sp. C21]